MFNFSKTLIAASALIATAGTASASGNFTAKFNYDASAPIEVTYASFEQTAKKACRISVRKAGGIAAKTKFEASCRAQLVSDAVEATKMDTLIAYHEQLTEPAKRVRQFASVD